jgi:hypothetical protein
MRWSILLLFLTLNCFVAIHRSQDRPDNAKKLIPQAQPIVKWLKAVKDGDQKKLKEVFAERMRKRFDEEGWEKALKSYKQAFQKEFGKYRLKDFTFEYSGGVQEGKVAIVYKGKKLPGVQVIKEQTDWKVDER